MSDRTASFLLILAGLFGAMAVAAGAFASHGLTVLKGERAAELWGIASHYQMIHAAAIVAAVLLGRQGARFAAPAGVAFALGCVLFPGALYALGWWGPSLMGAVAPLGGLSFMVGWACVAAAGIKYKP